jgi:two-component system sensor histidine kinase TctE
MSPNHKAEPDTLPSIRRRLLVLLMLPAVGILIAGTISDYLFSGAPFREAYDQALLGSALVLAEHVQRTGDGHATLSLPTDVAEHLRGDRYDSIYYKITGTKSRFIAGNADLPSVPTSGTVPGFNDVVYRGEALRVVSYDANRHAGPVTITVGETLRKRNRVRTAVVTSALAVDLGEVGVMVAMILIGVRIALNPLLTIEAQIARRSAKDLSPLQPQTVPIEIRSVVEALNRLFATVRTTSEAQRRFLESAAHQLRTPLAGISAQLELMTGEEADPPRRERLMAVFEGAQRLTHTTQQLLTLARSDEAASLQWEFTTVDLAELVQSVVTDRLTSADLAGIDLGAEIQPASIRGVRWPVCEALANLTNNAIAYTPAGGSVTVHCGLRERTPFLRVVDTGIGIPPAERSRVTERFFRASNTRGGGSGLGLAIVREVARLHGATVSIDAGPEDVGTAIEILFPPLQS